MGAELRYRVRRGRVSHGVATADKPSCLPVNLFTGKFPFGKHPLAGLDVGKDEKKIVRFAVEPRDGSRAAAKRLAFRRAT